MNLLNDPVKQNNIVKSGIPGRVQSRIIRGLSGIDSDDSDTRREISSGAEINSHGKPIATVETEGGRRVRVPGDGAYPGEPPYGAPLTGFHGKASDVFDAFVYLPSGQNASERPQNFFHIIGLVGDDPQKCDNPAWSLFGRMKAEVFKKVEEVIWDLKSSPSKPVVVVNGMRAENMAMFSVSEPHKMFAPSIWLAAGPIGILNHAVPVIDEAKVKALILGERALAQVEKMKSQQPKSAPTQMSLGF